MFIVTAAIGSVVAGALLLNALSPTTPGPAGAPASEEPMAAIGWDSGLVQLTASAMRITEGDEVFTGENVLAWGVHSDPGDAAYRTLQVEWQEQDVEQRLFLYFAADDTDWWVSELRTRDGFPDADWITYTGPFFTTPIGESYRGDISLASEDGRVPGTLELQDVTLTVPGIGGPEAVAVSVTDGREAKTEAVATSDVSSAAIGWDSGLVSLTADAMRIHQGDTTVTGEGVFTWDIHSDPGNAAYRTLEIVWEEQGVEQRLNLYLAADETDWWVSELRTRDGFPAADADGITYTGPFFTTPIGQSYNGDVSLTSEDGRVPGAIEFVNMVLAAPGLLGSEAPLANADNEPEPKVSADAEDEVSCPAPAPRRRPRS